MLLLLCIRGAESEGCYAGGRVVSDHARTEVARRRWRTDVGAERTRY